MHNCNKEKEKRVVKVNCVHFGLESVGQTLGGEISMSLESDDWKCTLGTVGMEGQADEK